MFGTATARPSDYESLVLTLRKWAPMLLRKNLADEAVVHAIQKIIPELMNFSQEPQHAREAYGRTVLWSTPDLEIMIARWRPDVECAPHDHGFSVGRVILLAGDFTETQFDWDEDDGLLRGASEFHCSPRVLNVDTGGVHAMKCLGEDGVTLHFYSPAIQGMKVFDSRSRRTFSVSADCGAWMPSPAQIVSAENWPSGQSR